MCTKTERKVYGEAECPRFLWPQLLLNATESERWFFGQPAKCTKSKGEKAAALLCCKERECRAPAHQIELSILPGVRTPGVDYREQCQHGPGKESAKVSREQRIPLYAFQNRIHIDSLCYVFCARGFSVFRFFRHWRASMLTDCWRVSVDTKTQTPRHISSSPQLSRPFFRRALSAHNKQ